MMITLTESARKSTASWRARNFGYFDRMVLFVRILEVRFERHDAGLLDDARNSWYSIAQQIDVVRSLPGADAKQPFQLADQRLEHPTGVLITNVPSAAPPMMMNSAG